MQKQKLTEIVDLLQRVGTDQQDIEVKSGVGKAVRETLSAFSNTTGGVLIVGLSEQDGFRPVSDFDAEKARDQLISECSELTPIPRPRIEIMPLGKGNGALILVAEIREMSAHDKPCYVTNKGLYNGSYIRAGDADIRLTPYEIDRLVEQRRQPLWDAEPVREATVEDLDEGLMRDYVAIQRQSRPRAFTDDLAVTYERLRILKDGHPTLASMLAMGDYPQEFFPRLVVSFSVFQGSSRGEVGVGRRLIDRATISGPIPDMLVETIGHVQRNMRVGGEIDGLIRRDIPDYPVVAIREALVNAIMHRDYSHESLGTAIQVSMFDDRLEIMNPGGLYGPVSIETLGKAGISATRNLRLAEILEAMRSQYGGMIAENRGSGIEVMRQALADAGMEPPAFVSTLSYFRVTMQRRERTVRFDVGPVEDRVMAFARTKDSFSTSEAVEATTASRSAVLKAINSFIESGQLQATRPARSPRQRYRLV